MTTTALALIPDATLTAGDLPYYTCPANTTAVFKRSVFSNTSAAAVSITVNVVRSGGTSGATNTLIPLKAIAPNDTYVAPEMAGLTLSAGDAVHAYASTGAVVNLMASGIQIV